MRIQIAIIAACAGTFLFAHTDLAQAAYPAVQEFIGPTSTDMGPRKAPVECFSRVNTTEKGVVVAGTNNYQQQMLIRNIRTNSQRVTRKK